jgi:hypothetical protein
MQSDRRCICSTLRVCEKRVTAYERSWENAVTIVRAGYRDGYDAALSDAREAVLGAGSIDVSSGRELDRPAWYLWMGHALAALDALKEKTHWGSND